MVKTLVMLGMLGAAAGAGCGSTATPPPNTPTAPVADPPLSAGPVANAGATGSAAAPPTPTTPPRADPPAPDPAQVKAALLASETVAWTTAKPAFDKACASCHTKDGKKAAKKKLDHFDMSSYPPGGHHTGTIGYTIREVLGLTDKPATMPYGKPGTVKGEDLALIKAWTDAWETAEKGGAHPPHGPDKDDD